MCEYCRFSKCTDIRMWCTCNYGCCLGGNVCLSYSPTSVFWVLSGLSIKESWQRDGPSASLKLCRSFRTPLKNIRCATFFQFPTCTEIRLWCTYNYGCSLCVDGCVFDLPPGVLYVLSGFSMNLLWRRDTPSASFEPCRNFRTPLKTIRCVNFVDFPNAPRSGCDVHAFMAALWEVTVVT